MQRQRPYLIVATSQQWDDPDREVINRRKLGPMVRGYIKRALATTNEDNFFGSGQSLAIDHSIDTISEATLAQMCRDCVSFYWRNRHDLETLYAESFDYGEEEAGSDFWDARNGRPSFDMHGFDEVWGRLEQSAQGFGPRNLWVDDNNEVAYRFDVSQI